MKKYDYSKDTLEKLVKESYSYAEIARKLGMHSKGGNYNTLRRNIKKWNLSTEHFVGQGWSKGKQLPNSRTPLEMYLSNSKPITSWKLKNKLIEAGIKKNKCEICGISEWNHKPIACQLHHKNGDNRDNRLDNLQILCPNCHSQTDSYAGKVYEQRNKRKNLVHKNLAKLTVMQTSVVEKLQGPRMNNFYLNLKNSIKILARWEENTVSQIMLFENGLNLMRNMGYDSRIRWFKSSYPCYECFAL